MSLAILRNDNEKSEDLLRKILSQIVKKFDDLCDGMNGERSECSPQLSNLERARVSMKAVSSLALKDIAPGRETNVKVRDAARECLEACRQRIDLRLNPIDAFFLFTKEYMRGVSSASKLWSKILKSLPSMTEQIITPSEHPFAESHGGSVVKKVLCDLISYDNDVRRKSQNANLTKLHSACIAEIVRLCETKLSHADLVGILLAFSSKPDYTLENREICSSILGHRLDKCESDSERDQADMFKYAYAAAMTLLGKGRRTAMSELKILIQRHIEKSKPVNDELNEISRRILSTCKSLHLLSPNTR